MTASVSRLSAVRSQVRAMLAELSPGARFADDEDVFASGVVGSMNLVELVTRVEDTYGLEVTQRDIFDGRLRSVDRLVGLVLAHADGPR
jgi:acyl carrier protein